MLGKLCPAVLLIVVFVQPAVAKMGDNTLEISPLKAAAGQPSVAWQRVLSEGIEGRIFAEYVRQNAERDDYEDTWFTLQMGLDLPSRLDGWLEGAFIGAGLSYQYGLIGQSSDRAYISSMRPDEREQDDRWVNQVQYLSVYQAAGFRYFMADYASVAIRFVVDQLLQERSRTVAEDVLSYSANTEAEPRQRVTQSLSLFAGFHF